VGEEYRIALKWFMLEIAIFYKITVDDRSNYRLLLPDIKKTFLMKNIYKKPYEKIPKYYFLSKFEQETTMFAMEVNVNKCKPTALDRPPQYDCIIKAPISFRNMLFCGLTIRRCSDNEIIDSLEPGASSYIYEIPYDVWYQDYRGGG
jgi:hypothetical protein